MILFIFSMFQNINTNILNKITYDINIFKVSFEITGKILSIDVGKKTLGLAMSDNLKKIALTHKTLFRKKQHFDLLEIEKIIIENKVNSFVIGLPLNKNGTKGKSSQSVITFASILLKRFNLPILLWDERFSSIGILKEMKKAGIKKDNIKKNIDAASATWILQSCLDTVNNQLVDENV